MSTPEAFDALLDPQMLREYREDNEMPECQIHPLMDLPCRLCEGVAAPLEPSALKVAQWIENTIGRRDDVISDVLVNRWAEMIGEFAAAVSKNLQQKLADADQAACTWIKDAELWRKLHKAATEELAKCGKENCVGYEADGVQRWVRAERLSKAEARILELEKEITS